MLLSDLQTKDIVNLVDGKKIGIIVDAEIDRSGKLTNFVVQKRKFLFFSGGRNLIGWKYIDKIGKDVILVNVKG
ncbi:MAG: YlmC/YmxH family sporulation protein [Bacilli bacterium]|nr:YlmC/YmxH family sporulation protein [Bacilli bacterium]